jgi:Cu-Zn family superoxide dismutase
MVTPGGPRASAVIAGRSGSSLSGRAEFVQLAEGVLVRIWVEGAPPGKHAVHVHEAGDCSASDGSSAGAHFNPDGHPHGGAHAEIHHAGDLGNMWVGADGRGVHQVVSHDLTVTAGTHSVRGRAIVVHADPDDLVSQPAGAAGARIGCGEIQ